MIWRSHVAAEERVLRAQLVIDPDQRLTLVAIALDAEVRGPHGSVVDGSRFAMFSAAGLNATDSHGVGERRPQGHLTSAVAAGDAKSVKSPASIDAVGTNSMLAEGR